MNEEVLRDTHPDIRRMLEAKAAWEKATDNRKDCEKRRETTVRDLAQRGVPGITSVVYQGQTAALQGKVANLQKLVSIEKQVESVAERQYLSAHKALFETVRNDYYKPALLTAFAEAGQVCLGHTVEVLDIEEDETFEVEVRPRSDIPLVVELYGKTIGAMIPVVVQGHCTHYKITGVRVSRVAIEGLIAV